MLYSNWDFNALGGAFEIMTKRDIYDALESDLARPIGMQDFDRSIHRKTGDSDALALSGVPHELLDARHGAASAT